MNVSGTSVSALPDFHALSTQMASVSPSSTKSTAYKVTNTVARACPTIDATWQALETLPPTPNSTLCNCMYSSLSCVAKPGVDTSAQLCDSNPSNCLGINKNATSGTYGAYSACDSTQQISWIMNQDYLSNKSTSPSCYYNGRGQIQSVSSAGPQCQELLDQAGPLGTGIVTTSIGADQGKSRGLSSAAKAGIAIAVAFVSVLIGVGVFVCGKKAMRQRARTPVPVEGGLEVGEAPPEFSALGRAELETNEAENPSNFQRESGGNEPTVLDNLFEGNDLSAVERRRELGNSGVSPQPEHSDLDRTAEITEPSDPSAPAYSELSGDSMIVSELSAAKRKPISGSATPQAGQTASPSPTPVSYSNMPWSNPGIENLGLEGGPGAQAATPNETADTAEMRRIEEEERRVDEAIAESERLQALRKQKEELQKRKLDMQARASGTTPS